MKQPPSTGTKNLSMFAWLQPTRIAAFVRRLWDFEGVVIDRAWVLWLLLHVKYLSGATLGLNLLEASQRNREDLCQLLVDFGSAQNEVDSITGLNPVLVACISGSEKSLAVLLRHENATWIALMQKDAKMRSPLYHACKGRHAGCVNQILGCCERLGMQLPSRELWKQLLEQVDAVGHTPLHAACLAVSFDAVEILLSAGANVNAIGRDGCTPIMLLTRTRLSSTLTSSEKQSQYLEKELQRGKIVGSLLERGARIDLRDCFGAGLVHLACGGCGCQVSVAILEGVLGYNVGLVQKHVEDTDNDGMSPLHILCQKAGTFEEDEVLESDFAFVMACQFLILNGTDPNKTDYGMMTPLMQLAWGTPNPVSVDLAQILLDTHKCNPCYETEGWSVLHIVYWNQNWVKSTLFETFQRFMTDHHESYMSSFSAKKPREEDGRIFSLQQKRIGVNNQFSREERRSLLRGKHNVEGISQHVVETMQTKKACKVVVLTGAGISVSCGIPDFRSPESGVYASEKYKNAFNRDTLNSNPSELWTVVKDMLGGVLSGETKPSLTHCFIRMLHEQGMLLRNFTQNIDMLETKVGIPAEKVVEAHGSIARAKCMSCGHETTVTAIQDQILDDTCPCPRCSICKGVYRPDVVLFGEPVPAHFIELSVEDIKAADLLIVIGTSLKVYPFAGLVNQVGPLVPRLLVNRVHSGPFERLQSFPDACKVRAMIPPDDSMQVAQTVQERELLTGKRPARTSISLVKRIFGGATRSAPPPQNESLGSACETDIEDTGSCTMDIEDTSSYRDAVYIGDSDDGVRELARHLGWEQDLLDMHFNL